MSVYYIHTLFIYGKDPSVSLITLGIGSNVVEFFVAIPWSVKWHVCMYVCTFFTFVYNTDIVYMYVHMYIRIPVKYMEFESDYFFNLREYSDSFCY